MQNEHVERVAGALRAEMARRKVSQSQLAGHLGMSQMAVSRRVSGETPLDIAELFAAADYLGVPVTALLALDHAA